jgi:hypothetical protein
MFKTQRALGGHTSKGHPGKSSKYAKKIKTREKRTSHRFFLDEAKKKYAELYPG